MVYSLPGVAEGRAVNDNRKFSYGYRSAQGLFTENAVRSRA